MQKLREHILVENKFRRVSEKVFRKNDQKEIQIMTYETVPNPDGVIVLGRTKEGDFLLIEEYRFGPEKILLTTVAWASNTSESGLDAALRELREETGYMGEKALFLGKYVHNYYITWYLSYYFVDGLEKIGEQSLDPNEEIIVKKYTQTELEMMIENGTIECPYTVGLYLLAKSKTNNFTQKF